MRTYDVDSIDNRNRRAIEGAVTVIEPMLETLFHPVVRGLDRIPEGKGLYVANHNGGILFPEAYVFGAAVYRHCGMEDMPYVLAHDLAVRPPIMNQLFVPLGGVRASPANANRLFHSERKVLVFPGGDMESYRPFRDRDQIVFGPRRGYVRLALEHGVPIIPIVTAGAHAGMIVLDDGGRVARALGIDRVFRVKVFPIVLSIPWGLSIGFPPPYIPMPTRIYQEVLAPIRFDRAGKDAASDPSYVEECHLRVMTAMQAALTRLAAERRADKRARHLARFEELRAQPRVPSWLAGAIEDMALRVGFTPPDEPEQTAASEGPQMGRSPGGLHRPRAGGSVPEDRLTTLEAGDRPNRPSPDVILAVPGSH